MTDPSDIIYAVGDVHGESRLFVEILRSVRQDAESFGIARPHLVLLGDLIDRGPDSKGVLDIVSSDRFEDVFDAVILRGNHEQWCLDALMDPACGHQWLHSGGAETVESYGLNIARCSTHRAMLMFYATVPARHRFVLMGAFTSYHTGNLFFCHGGVDPGLPLDSQPDMNLLYGCQAFHAGQDHPHARVVHGHIVTDGAVPDIRPGRICVDTGSGYQGRPLSAVAIEGSGAVRVLQAYPEPTATARPALPPRIR